MTNVNDVVAARIAAARARAEATKRRRATQQAARQAGLVERYRIKLARMDAAEKGFVPANEPLSNASVRPTESDALSTTEPTSRSPEREVAVRPNDDFGAVPANGTEPRSDRATGTADALTTAEPTTAPHVCSGCIRVPCETCPYLPTEASALAVATPDLAARVRALHREEFGVCVECSGEASVLWPCPTIDTLIDHTEGTT